MSRSDALYQKALGLIDDANRQDPNIVNVDGRDWPKELIYSERMSDMLSRFNPAADHPQQLAIRAQHIERWKSPRNAYPMDRMGYLKWRKDLYKIQADTAARLLEEAGYDEASIKRLHSAVAKKNIKGNPDTQLLEDVTDLCFMEHYLLDFYQRHPDYDEDKWIEIIQKTWNKMSDEAHQFVLDGNISLPESLIPVIMKAVSPNHE
ncbi:MAG: DUF4202 domain-containing protein [Pseudomonadota bacterium]